MADSRRAGAPKRVAIVGGGWAGCAAAVELSRAGHRVALYEAARTMGGRARRVELAGGNVDNGQHILLGAYSASLRMLKLVGIEPRQALLNLPLQMRYPAGSGGMDFIAPRWPAPLHLAAALLRARGLARADKMALARFSSTARWMGWQLDKDCSVSALLERYDQTPRLIQLMWRPLCLAALNTPPERASARIFLNVLRDSLGAARRASDMLLPRIDLSALFPDAAARLVEQHGGQIHCGASVTGVRRQDDGRWQVSVRDDSAGGFDAVILATPPLPTTQLLAQLQHPASDAIAAQLAALEPEAISTCYLQYDPDVRLSQAFFALIDTPAAGQWGQFVFDRGQLDANHAGLLAVVISASADAAAQGQAALSEAIARQLAEVFRRPELARPLWSRLITEKRATFACTPDLARPANATGLAGLALAGDYTACDYPATIESAVRSGVLAAASLR